MPYAVVIAFIVSLFTTSLADQTAFLADARYNKGEYGSYVTQTFKSNPQVTAAPIVNFMKPFTSCDDGSYLMICPRGTAVDPTLMILDVTGSPVWASTQKYGEVYNLQVQRYKGEPFLTFWGGNDSIGGHGIGTHFMLDQQYRERYRIHAASGLGADLHVFSITESGTALVSIYNKKLTNLSSKVGDERQGWIWDSIFQEVDLETGEAVFEWRANDHIDVAQSYAGVFMATEAFPWDAYHLNSVGKDDLGNYLISCRYLRAVTYIDGKTGDVLWQLGGHNNSFRDLSAGKATTFLGQHDSHFLQKDEENGKTFVTLFNNNGDWEHRASDQSTGLQIQLDLSAMTAEVSLEVFSPTAKVLSVSQGSYQTLPNGHIVLGYGLNGAMSEFSEDGKLLCEAYFQPLAKFGSGQVQSYRNLRFNWTAYPTTKPSLVFDEEEQKLFMSWNGATEVAAWLLVDSDEDDNDTDSIPRPTNNAVPHRKSSPSHLIIPKSGFETEFPINAFINSNSSSNGSSNTNTNRNLRRFLRVTALDSTGKPLGTSHAVDIGDLATSTMQFETDVEDSFLIAIGGFVGLGVVLVALWWNHRRKGGAVYEILGQDENDDVGLRKGRGVWERVLSTFPGIRRRRRSGKRRDSGSDWGDLELDAMEGLLTEEESRVIAASQMHGIDRGYR